MFERISKQKLELWWINHIPPEIDNNV